MWSALIHVNWGTLIQKVSRKCKTPSYKLVVRFSFDWWQDDAHLAYSWMYSEAAIDGSSYWYLLTPCSRVLLEKLIGLQLVKKYPAFYGTPKIHCRIHKCPPPVPILSQLGPVHTPKSHFLKTHRNIIRPSTPGSPKWSLFLRFSHHKLVYAFPLTHTRYMPCPSLSSRFDHPHNIGRGIQIIKLLLM